jgi:hypothetical protein
MLHYFGVSSIGISRIGVSRLANTWGPHLGTPGAEIPKYNNFSTPYFSGLRKSGFRDLRVQGKLTLGSSGFRKAKMPNQVTLCQFGIPRVGFRISELRDTRGRSFTLLDYPNAEKPIHPLIIHLTKFGVSQFGISQLVGTRELILEYPGSRNTEHQYLPMLVQFGVSRIEVSRRAQTGGLAPRSSGSRNSEIQTLKPAHLFRDFTHRNFVGRGFGTCEYKELASRYPGYRNSEIL